MGIFPEFISKLMGGKKDAAMTAPPVGNEPSIGVTGATATTGTESGQGANTALDVSGMPTTTASSEAPSTVTTVDSNLGVASPVNTAEQPTPAPMQDKPAV